MEEKKLVDSGELLLRRGYGTPEKKFMNPDGTATSRVFKLREKDNGELSVDVESLTTAEKAVIDPLRFMLFKIANNYVFELSLETCHSPTPGGQNDAHAVIVGMDLDDEIMPGLLAKASQRIYV